MKKPLSEETEIKIRQLLIKAQHPLGWAMDELFDAGKSHTNTYKEAAQSLILINEIIKELGYKEPEGTTLKQINLF